MTDRPKIPCPRCGQGEVCDYQPGCESCWDETKWSNVSFADTKIAEDGKVTVHLPEWWRVPEGYVLMFWFRNVEPDAQDPLEDLVTLPERGVGVKGDPESESQVSKDIGKNVDWSSGWVQCSKCYTPMAGLQEGKSCEKCFLEELAAVFRSGREG